MPERLVRDYRIAQRMSRAGAIALYAIAALCLVVGIVFIVSVAQQNVSITTVIFQVGLALFTSALLIAAVTLLAEFLRHFGTDRSPFGKTQSRRLLGSAVLFSIRVLLDSFIFPVGFLPELGGSLSIPPTTTQINLDLKVVAVVVFLVCLAMVVRYGDALKEDSDAFV